MRNARNCLERLAKEPSESAMKEVVLLARAEALADQDIATLATMLAGSGRKLKHDPGQSAAGIASTGGPTSLSTLVCPLYLRALGQAVPNLTVPGRPAGAVDVLAQIPGYKVHMSPVEATDSLRRSGIVHLLANGEYAPLDAALFAYRRRTDTQAVPALVIGSLLAKKLAAGVRLFGVDVRVAPHGNFGATWDEARANAVRLCRVSSILNIETVCFLTDASMPYQPFVGRSESLLALAELFSGNPRPWLREHASLCFAMASSTAGNENPRQPAGKELQSLFFQNLVAQGSGSELFERQVEKTARAHQHTIHARNEGYLSVDLRRLRTQMVQLQSRHASPEALFPDPCGVIMLVRPGDYVERGTPLATMRIAGGMKGDAKPTIESVFDTTLVPGRREVIFEEVRNG